MRRILIVAPAWVGDMVMAQSLVAALMRASPGAGIDLVAPPWTAPLGLRMPGVGKTHAIGAAHGRFDLGVRFRLGRALRKERYDLGVVLPRSLKSALVPFFAGIRERRGYRGEMRYGLLNDIRPLDPRKLVRTVDRFIALAAERGGPIPDVELPRLVADSLAAQAAAAKLALANETRPVIALCPGAEFGPAKQWPALRFAELGAILAREGFAVWLLGSPKDAAIADEVCRLAAERGATSVNLVGKTSLLEAVDLISLASGVVANDSGLMHVAAALGRPVVALYGSTPSTVAPPLSTASRIAERTLPCRPCFQRTCPLGHLDCLNLIGADDVLGLLIDAMRAAERAPQPAPSA